MLLAIGVPETAAMVIALIVSMIVSIVIDIIITIVIEVATYGVGTEVTVALWSAKISYYTVKVAASIAKVVTQAIEKVCLLVEKIGAIGKVIASTVRALIKVIEKGLAMLFDLVSGIMKAMKKIESALDDLGKAIDHLTDIPFKKLRTALGGTGKTADEAFDGFVDALKSAKGNITSLDKSFKQEGTVLSRSKAEVKALEELKGSWKDYKSAAKVKEGETPELDVARGNLDAAMVKVKEFDPDLADLMKAHVDLKEADAVSKAAKLRIKDLEKLTKEMQAGTITANREGLERAWLSAKSFLRTADAQLEEAMMAMATMNKSGWISYIFRAKAIVEHVFGVAQGMVSMFSNILQGQLAMLKAEFAAYATEIDYFIKLMKNMFDKLMDSVTKLGEEISQIGKEIKQLFRSNSQTMTSLSMV